jgi:hypothetical protein
MLDEKKVPGTCEADCQKFPVTNDSIGIMRAPFEKGAPRSGGGTNLSKRFPAGATKYDKNEMVSHANFYPDSHEDRS